MKTLTAANCSNEGINKVEQLTRADTQHYIHGKHSPRQRGDRGMDRMV